MNRKKLLLISLAALLALAVAGGALYNKRRAIFNTDTPAGPAQEVNGNDETLVNQVDLSPADPFDNNDITDRKEGENAGQTPPPPTSSDVSISLTRAAQGEGGLLQIRALLSGTTTGTCHLKLSKDDNTLTKTADVGVEGTFVTCRGFDIPRSELTASGDWNLQLYVSNDQGTSKTITQTVTIE